jgi:hypothetical protein
MLIAAHTLDAGLCASRQGGGGTCLSTMSALRRGSPLAAIRFTRLVLHTGETRIRGPPGELEPKTCSLSNGLYSEAKDEPSSKQGHPCWREDTFRRSTTLDEIVHVSRTVGDSRGCAALRIGWVGSPFGRAAYRARLVW